MIVGAIVLAFSRLAVGEWSIPLKMEDDIRAALADLQSVILVPQGVLYAPSTSLSATSSLIMVVAPMESSLFTSCRDGLILFEDDQVS